MRTKWTTLLVVAITLVQCQKQAIELVPSQAERANLLQHKFQKKISARFVAALLLLDAQGQYEMDQLEDLGNQLISCAEQVPCLRQSVSPSAALEFFDALRQVELPEIEFHLDSESWITQYDRMQHSLDLKHRYLNYSLHLDMDNESDDAQRIGIIPTINETTMQAYSALSLHQNLFEPILNDKRVSQVQVHTHGEQIRFGFRRSKFPHEAETEGEFADIISVEFYLDVHGHLGMECTNMFSFIFNQANIDIKTIDTKSEEKQIVINDGESMQASFSNVRKVHLDDAYLGQFELITYADQFQMRAEANQEFLSIDFDHPVRSMDLQLVHNYLTIMKKVNAR